MSGDESRRFTDREVALVLQRAAEVEEAESTTSGRGLTLGDLHEIGREVGISPGAIDRAVATLGRSRGAALGGAPLVRRSVHAVPGELGDSALANLVTLVDERADGAGSLSEALGSVRWIGRTRRSSTQVSITPRGGETVIEVAEKAEPQLRSIFHFVPGLWGGMLGVLLAAPLGAPALGITAAVAGGVVLGLASGRVAWAGHSSRSARRVEGLAAELADAALRLADPRAEESDT